MTYSHNLPPIFVISLKRASDRRDHLKAELAKHKLDYQIIDAVDGSKLDDVAINKVYCEKQTLEKCGRKMVKSEIGCALSHLSVYQKMLDENIPQAIILEDDIIIGNDFVSVAQNINNAKPKKWQLILFGYGGRTNKQNCFVNVTKPNKALSFILQKPLTIAYCTYAYLINQDGAKSILSQTTTIYQPIDNITGDYKLLDVYCVSPICVSVDFALPSAIEYDRETMMDQALQDKNERIRETKIFAKKQVLKGKFPILLKLGKLKIKYHQLLNTLQIYCYVCSAIYKIQTLCKNKYPANK